MRLIKQIATDIECNISEAEDKIDTAYRMKSVDANVAAWYREMASAHLAFNAKGHDLVAAVISNAKVAHEYAEHPDYYEGMMAVWEDKHQTIVANSARVKAMVDSFK